MFIPAFCKINKIKLILRAYLAKILSRLFYGVASNSQKEKNMKKLTIVLTTILILSVSSCKKEPTVDGSSEKNFDKSFSQMSDTLSKEQQTQLMEALMKLGTNLDIGEVSSQDETRIKGQEKLRQILDGKSFNEIITMAKDLPLGKTAKKAIDDLQKTGTSSTYQHDADIVRLKHLKYLGGLIEEYHEETGRYPLQSDDNIENYVNIASFSQKKYTQGGPPYEHRETAVEEFKVVLEKGLGRNINLPFDPQLVPVNKPNFYIYMVKGDQYYLAVHLYDGSGFARKIAPYYFKAEISNISVSSQKIYKYNELMNNPEYQKRINDEFILKRPKNPEQAEIEF